LQSRIVKIDSTIVNQRIDNYLISRLKGVPHSRIYRALRQGEVRVNKKRVSANYRLQENDLIRIPPIRMSEARVIPKPSAQLTVLLKKAIIFENQALLVINKPVGLAVHGGSNIALGLIESLRAIQPRWSLLQLVHRLDRDTSGCLLLAKNRVTLLALQKMFRTHDIRKEYILLVQGHVPTKEIVETRLEKIKRGGEKIITVASQGKLAKTIFEPIAYREGVHAKCETSEPLTLLRAHLFTGRMHQVRVHAAHKGHPIVGDAKYGDKAFNRKIAQLCGEKQFFLHAEKLSFTLQGEPFSFTAPLTTRFLDHLKQLEIAVKLPEYTR